MALLVSIKAVLVSIKALLVSIKAVLVSIKALRSLSTNTPRTSRLHTHTRVAISYYHAALVRGNHILDVDVGVGSAEHLKHLQRLVY